MACSDTPVLFVALFDRPVNVGDINPPGECDDPNYERMALLYPDYEMQELQFTGSEGFKEDHLITHIALMTEKGIVVKVIQILKEEESDDKKPCDV